LLPEKYAFKIKSKINLMARFLI